MAIFIEKYTYSYPTVLTQYIEVLILNFKKVFKTTLKIFVHSEYRQVPFRQEAVQAKRPVD